MNKVVISEVLVSGDFMAMVVMIWVVLERFMGVLGLGK